MLPNMFRVFKARQPRGFQYKPMYYDPDKEARDKRLADAKREISFREKQGNESPEQRQISFRRKFGDDGARASRSQQMKASNMRLLIILLVLVGAAFILWSYVKAKFVA